MIELFSVELVTPPSSLLPGYITDPGFVDQDGVSHAILGRPGRWPLERASEVAKAWVEDGWEVRLVEANEPPV